MLKTAALVFGIVFVAIGLLGFVPALAPENAEGHRLLLGIFEVDATHNIIHLLSGLAALAAASSAKFARLYFQIFGVIYAIVTLWGLTLGSPVLGFLHVNAADNILHLVIAVAALYFGFMYRDDADSHVGADPMGV